MKKFCSKCGNVLNLSSKHCTGCNAFNPFYIAGYKTVTTDVTHKIDSTLNKAQAEATAELENARKTADELAELARNEQQLKSELQKVKEETALHQKQTAEIVSGFKRELHEIDSENRLLKERLESMQSTRISTVDTGDTWSPNPNKRTSKRVLVVAGFLLAATTAASYLYFNHSGTQNVNTAYNKPGTNIDKPAVQHPEKTPPEPVKKSVVPNTKLLAVAAPLTANSVVTTPAPVKSAAIDFTLTPQRIITDLVGKKLSGCDISVNAASEIAGVSNLVMVEKLSSSYVKYKCNIKVVQKDGTYNSTPYLYYSPQGTFIKVDGTNCE